MLYTRLLTYFRAVIMMAILLIAALADGSEPLVAMRVDLAWLGGGPEQTAFRIDVTIAPEDRPRLGSRVWGRAAVSSNETELAAFSGQLVISPQGTSSFEMACPPGSYRLRVDLESPGGAVRGFWVQEITVPELEDPRAEESTMPDQFENEPPAGRGTSELVRTPASAEPHDQEFSPPSADTTSPEMLAEQPMAPTESQTTAASPPASGERELSFLVVDVSGRPVIDWDERALTLSLEGARARVLEIRGPGDPLHLGIVFDPALDSSTLSLSVRRLMGRMVEQVSRSGGRAFVAWPEGSGPWRSGSVGILEDAAIANGSSDLAPAVLSALDRLSSVAGRRLLLILSSDAVTVRGDQWRELAAAASNHGIPFLVLGVDEGDLERRTRRRLSELAESSGGRSYFVRDPGTLEITARLYAEICSAVVSLRFEHSEGPVEVEIVVDIEGLEARHSPRLD